MRSVTSLFDLERVRGFPVCRRATCIACAEPYRHRTPLNALALIAERGVTERQYNSPQLMISGAM